MTKHAVSGCYTFVTFCHTFVTIFRQSAQKLNKARPACRRAYERLVLPPGFEGGCLLSAACRQEESSDIHTHFLPDKNQ